MSTPSFYRLISHAFTAVELKFTIEICCLKSPNKRSRTSSQSTDDISAFCLDNESKDRFQLYTSRLNGTKFCEVIEMSEISLTHSASDGSPCELNITPKQGTGQRTDVNCGCVIASVKEWVRLKPSISQKNSILVFAYRLMDVDGTALPARFSISEELRDEVIHLSQALTNLTEVMQFNFLMLSDRLAMVEAKQNKIWETFQHLSQPPPETSSSSSSSRTSLTPTHHVTRRY